MKNRIAEDLDRLFQAQGDPDRAGGMRWYMKNQFDYYGVSSPLRKSIVRQYFQDYGYPSTADLPEILLDLWEYDQREMQYAGLDLIRRLTKKQPAGFIDVLEKLILSKSWWDTVDALSVDAGTLLRIYPELQPGTTDRWIASDNFWLQRAAILHQLKYKEATNFDRMQDYILNIAHRPEFFLRKAAGWALREYSKTSPQGVKAFIERHRGKLSGLTIREGSKYV
jgi:3-methyladenine DNA glycosylase AlkD